MPSTTSTGRLKPAGPPSQSSAVSTTSRTSPTSFRAHAAMSLLLREAHQALAATIRNFPRLMNDSLCHGRTGNAELFLLRRTTDRARVQTRGERAGPEPV